MDLQGRNEQRDIPGTSRKSPGSIKSRRGSHVDKLKNTATSAPDMATTNHESSMNGNQGNTNHHNTFISTTPTTANTNPENRSSIEVENFPRKLYRMLEAIERASSTTEPKNFEDPFGETSLRSIVSWLHPRKKVIASGALSSVSLVVESSITNHDGSLVRYTPFKVFDQERFVQETMPRHFQMTKFKSFLRQLNMWGFSRDRSKGPAHGAYYHIHFDREDPSRISNINRVKVKGLYKRATTLRRGTPPSLPSPSSSPSAESTSSLSTFTSFFPNANKPCWVDLSKNMATSQLPPTVQGVGEASRPCREEGGYCRDGQQQYETDSCFEMIDTIASKKRQRRQDKDAWMFIECENPATSLGTSMVQRSIGHSQDQHGVEERNIKRRFRQALSDMEAISESHSSDHVRSLVGKERTVGFQPGSPYSTGMSSSLSSLYLSQRSNARTSEFGAASQVNTREIRDLSITRPMISANGADAASGDVQRQSNSNHARAFSIDDSNLSGVAEEDLKYVRIGFSLGASLRQQRLLREFYNAPAASASTSMSTSTSITDGPQKQN